MSKIVEIRPNPNFSGNIVGSLKISGDFKDTKGKVILSTLGRESLKIDGNGMLLQPDLYPLHADIIKAATESPTFSAMLSYPKEGQTLSANQRFYLHDQELHEQKEHDVLVESHRLSDEILNMDDARVVNFAKIFGIYGSAKKCKNELVKFSSDKVKAKEIADYFNNPDRLILEVIHASLEKGNASEKKGLYAENGYYSYMGNAIGYGIDKVVLWCKEEKDIYIHLKGNVYKDEVMSSKVDKKNK
jgi:hypothetical protein